MSVILCPLGFEKNEICISNSYIIIFVKHSKSRNTALHTCNQFAGTNQICYKLNDDNDGTNDKAESHHNDSQRIFSDSHRFALHANLTDIGSFVSDPDLCIDRPGLV